MQGRRYTVAFDNVGATVAQDIFELTAADDKPIGIYGIAFGQSSDVGDAQEEILRVEILRGHTTSGSGGSTATPRPLNAHDAAAGFVCEINNTTIASAGTAVVLDVLDINVRVGERFWLPDDSVWMTDQGSGLIVARILSTPADSLTIGGVLYVEEI